MHQEEIADLFENCNVVLRDHCVDLTYYGLPELEYDVVGEHWYVVYRMNCTGPRKYLIRFDDIHNLSRVTFTHTIG